jgi:hypothetical protein
LGSQHIIVLCLSRTRRPEEPKKLGPIPSGVVEFSSFGIVKLTPHQSTVTLEANAAFLSINLLVLICFLAIKITPQN